MKFIVTFFVIAFSVVASAADIVSQIKAENPTATAYQILEKAFNQSQDPITMDEIEPSDLPASQIHSKCVYAREKDQEPQGLGKQSLYKKRMKKAGRPSQGPLFPGTPDQTKWFVDFNNSSRSSNSDGSFDKITVLASKVEITEEYKSDLVNKIMLIRKSGDLFTLKMISNSKDAKSEILYSYCWKE